MNTGDALLRACLDTPDDDLPRLVYADWLQENGAPERAEFIRLQLLIAQHKWTGDVPAGVKAREAELLSAHEAEWNPLPPRRTGGAGHFDRGFLSHASVTTDEEATAVAHCPEVTHVEIGESCTDTALMHLARLPFLSELRLYELTLTGEGMRALAQHPRLRRIDLHVSATIANPWLHYLRDTPRLVRVRSNSTYRSEAAPKEWAAWEQARAERFRLLSVEDQQRAAQAFLFDENERWGANVGKLNLIQSHITDADIELLAAFPELEDLSLDETMITNRGLRHLADLADLRVLHVGFNAIDNLGGLARMTQLRDLGLIGMGADRNGEHEWTLTDAGTAALATLTGLEALDLRFNPITDVTLARLTGLTELRKLELADTRITNAGLYHLQGLKKLEHLDLRNTEVTAKAVKELRTHLPRAKVLWKSE